jgi:hypothetical protein
LVAFIAVTILGLRGYRSLDLQPRPWLVVVAAVIGTPLALFLNALEFGATARIAGTRVPLGRSVSVAVVASASNALPIPGSLLVRNMALVSTGSAVRTALGATVVTGVAWLGVTVVGVGAFAVGTDLVAGVLVLSAGLLLIAVAGVLLARRVRGSAWRGLFVALLAIEAATALSEAGRYLLVLRALDVDGTFLQAFALAVANVLATATGIFPGGLGVREALAGLLGAAASLPAAVAVTVSAVDRMATTLVLAVIAIGLLILGRTPRIGGWLRGSPLRPEEAQ